MDVLKILTALLNLARVGVQFALKHIELVLVSCLVLFAAAQYYVRPQNQSLDQVVANGVLRVLIADEPDSVYTFNRQHYGFEYELLVRYAETLGVSLEVDVVPYAELFTLLEGGQGDIAVGGIIDSDYVRRVSQPTHPWYQAKTTVMYKRGTQRPKNMEDFQQEKVLASSRYYQINQLQELNLEDDYRSEYELLAAVNNGTERFVLSTNYRARSAKFYLPNLNRSFILPDKLGVVWVLPKRFDEKLLDSLNAFLQQANQTGLSDQLADEYFKSPKLLSPFDTMAIHRKIQQVLPTFEYKFRTAARLGNLDWQLLAAVAYQESHWSNDAESPTGVKGIMQLTTQTADFLGVSDRMNMSESIDAAAIYLKKLKKKLPKSIKEPESTWFAVGAYNMGFRHIMAGHKKAKLAGLNANQWSTVGALLPTLYDQPFSQGVQAKNYVERVQIYTDIIRFYDSHLRDKVNFKAPLQWSNNIKVATEPSG